MSGTLSGTAYVGAGLNVSGEDSGTTIVGGGQQFVGYDHGTGTAIDTTLSGGNGLFAQQFVGLNFGTGFTTGAIIGVFAEQHVGDGSGAYGSATSTTIVGGTQYVGLNGGSGDASYTTLTAGEQYVGYLGGTGSSFGATLDGGFQFVGVTNGFGTATSTTIEAGAQQWVGDGGYGSADDTVVSGDQWVGINNGTGTATNTTIGAGGYQYLGNQGGNGTALLTEIQDEGVQVDGFGFGVGSASGTMIDSGGQQIVGNQFGRGFASDTTISSGGTQFVGLYNASGAATTVVIQSGGVEVVGESFASGRTSGVIVSAGGVQYLGSDHSIGTDLGAQVYGTQYVGADSTAVGTETGGAIYGTQYVGFNSASGTSIDDTIETGGTQFVGDGIEQFVSGAPVNSAVALSATVELGGDEYLGYSGGYGYASAATLSGGVQHVGSGLGTVGSADATTIVGGLQYVGEDSGQGDASGTTIKTLGEQIVGQGGGAVGSALDTTIDNTGEQIVGGVVGSGYASHTIVSGRQYVGSGVGAVGSAIDTSVMSGGVQDVGVATPIILNARPLAAVRALAGGYATSTTVFSGAAQYVGDGLGAHGFATATMLSGGVQSVGVNQGAGAVVDTTILSGGTQYVGDGLSVIETADDTFVSNGGVEIVSAGGAVSATSVYSGGLVEVLSGGVVEDSVIDGGTLRLDAASALASGTISFGPHVGAFDLSGDGFGSSFDDDVVAKISGFVGAGGVSDALVFAGTGGDHLSWSQGAGSGTLRILDSSDTVLENLTLTGAYLQDQFLLTRNGLSDIVTYDSDLPCFVRGTRILTERGEIAVEALQVGDVAVAASGARRPIVWLGRRALQPARHREPMSVQPVVVGAGAFGENLPRRDLWLSPGHNIADDGVLMPISSLVNGVSIAQVEVERVEYWHVELDAHDILLAEGLPAESYLDAGNRTAFENGGDFLDAHPNFMARRWDETCLPLAQSGPEVARVKARLLARLAERGHPIVDDGDPHLLVDGVRIEPERPSPLYLVFTLPEGARDVTLRSRQFVPKQTIAESDDTRLCGLCVRRLEIDGVEVDLGGGAALGWNDAELRDGRFARRWTTGSAPLPAGARVVSVELAGLGRYWAPTEVAPLAMSA